MEMPETAPKSPARLVFLLQDLKFGGTQRQTLELARLLDPTRFQAEIWLMMAGDDLAPLAHSWGIPLVWLGRQDWVGPAALANLWRRLRLHPVHVLMLLTVVPNIWGRLLGRLTGVQVIVGNCRGGTAPRRQHESWLWPLAHHILCNSAALQATLTGRYGVPGRRVSVIVNGVDTDFFQPPRAAAPSHPARVLSVARLVPDKDHETLIHAFRQVAVTHAGAELWLVGDGPREGLIRQLVADHGLTARVRFLPGQADLRPLLGQADMLALSSRSEALPNVVLEAMAAGLPVVATAVGGLPEVVASGRTGWLVPPGDPIAMAAAISRLLGDPEMRAAFGLAGRRRVEQDFSLTAMARRHEEVLQSLLARKSTMAKLR